ncbi:MAG: extracellular solute-binding protein [Pirellulales bacterium]|nr:extracellular solute-binding protein [Pirellulales bacterium]
MNILLFFNSSFRLTLLASFWFILSGCNFSDQREVIIYVSVDRKDAEPILKQFQVETGIAVRALYDSEAAKTTGLVTRILAEQENPRCDIFWNNEHVQTMLLAKQGLCAEISPTQTTHIDEMFKSPDGVWASVATRARVIVFNTEMLDRSKAPKTWQALSDPQWHGKCAIADPQFGTTRTHMAFLSARHGPQWLESFLGSMLENNVLIVNGNSAVKDLVGTSNSPVCVGITDTDDVYTGKFEGQPIEMIVPDVKDGGTLIIPSTVCILKNSPHPLAAQQLCSYLLSKKAGEQLVESNPGYTPLHKMNTLGDGYPTSEDVLNHLISSSRWTRNNFFAR